MKYLQRVTVGEKCLDDYRGIVRSGLLEEIDSLAEKLRWIRLIHVNATPDGGGVAEILRGLAPLFRHIGIQTEWYVLKDGHEFFSVTKKIHHLLQGKRGELSEKEKRVYIDANRAIGEELSTVGADVLVVHDPQPLAAGAYLHQYARVILHLHIDFSKPNRKALEFLEPLISPYHRIVVSLPEYGAREPWADRRVVIPPAIDPLSAKNKPMREKRARAVIEALGVDPDKPILLQVLRFDLWKDPFGTIAVHRMLKKKFPDLQTVLVGFNIAQDDAEAKLIYRNVQREAANLRDVFLFFDLAGARGRPIDTVVSAFFTHASVIIHKSIREGFGLVVTEAMWKGKAVVGGDVGGIRYQIEDGVSGYLVSDAKQAAQRIETLLLDPLFARHIGQNARDRVRKHFLLPRMLRDYLRLLCNIGMPLLRISSPESRERSVSASLD